MVESNPDIAFGKEWANKKLDMVRRHQEISQYIQDYLQDVLFPGTIIDIGCGPGDFLDMFKRKGHDVLGIDAPDGFGGMGNPYIEACRKLLNQAEIPFQSIGCNEFLNRVLSEEEYPRGEASLINMRGSIEQCFASSMIGPSHDQHHECKLLDWNDECIRVEFRRLIMASDYLLKPGGILLISANGTKCTDILYDKVIRELAGRYFELTYQEGVLLHKWKKS